MYLNKFQTIGYIGNDAVIRQVEDKRVIGFNLATTKKYTKKNNKVKQTIWLNCSYWRNQNASTKIAEYLKKGTPVFVEGEISADLYEQNEGEFVPTLNVRVFNIVLVGSNKNLKYSEDHSNYSNEEEDHLPC